MDHGLNSLRGLWAVPLPSELLQCLCTAPRQEEMKIAVFSREDSAVVCRAPSLDARACPEGQEYQRMVVEMLREEYGDDFVGTPPAEVLDESWNAIMSESKRCKASEALATLTDTACSA